MFIIRGKRKLRIKKYTDHHNTCNECKAFDLEVKVYKEYFQFFFIPFVPAGIKTSSVTCKNCGTPTRFDSLQKHYEDITKLPIYLYSGLIIILTGVVFMVIVNIQTQKEKRRFVENPQPGDVYQIRNEIGGVTTYSFLKINKISDDSVFAWHNSFLYNGFVSKLDGQDYFMKEDQLTIAKPDLIKMLDSAVINSVERGYGDSEGFNRIK